MNENVTAKTCECNILPAASTSTTELYWTWRGGSKRASLWNEHDEFCYMPPFNGSCEVPEQQMEAGVVTIAATRHLHDSEEKCQTKSGQPSPSPQVIVKNESGINSHANDSWRKNAVTKCEDWGQKERRSLRTPKHTDKPIPPAGNNDLKPNHRRNFKRERNFKSTGPHGREEDSYDQKAEVRTRNFFHKKDNRASYHN